MVMQEASGRSEAKERARAQAEANRQAQATAPDRKVPVMAPPEKVQPPAQATERAPDITQDQNRARLRAQVQERVKASPLRGSAGPRTGNSALSWLARIWMSSTRRRLQSGKGGWPTRSISTSARRRVGSFNTLFRAPQIPQMPERRIWKRHGPFTLFVLISTPLIRMPTP